MTGIPLGERAVPRSAVLEGSRFSTPSDYIAYLLDCGRISNPEEAWMSPEMALAIQRHWYWQGQVGCLFARRTARYWEQLGWRTWVITSYLGEMTSADLTTFLETHLRDAAASSTCELASFLFPQVRESGQLVPLIRALIAVEGVTLARVSSLGPITALSLQANIVGTDVNAWLLGLGPFEYLPQTRRAPSVEIIVRPKVKPISLFHRINQDRSVSHIADMPLQISDDYAELVWQGTLRNVERNLGHKPDRASAATTTFCVPAQLWK